MNDTAPARDRRPQILLVEDNLINQEVVLAMLEDYPYALHLAEDGKLALALLAREHIDLILMDCHLPGMDGYDTTLAIRAGETAQNRPHVPIIAVTANAGLSDRTRCLASGMNDYLSKPFELRQLLDVLERWLSAPDSGPTK